MTVFLVIITALLAVFASAVLSAPLWVVLLPLFFRAQGRVARISGLAVLGLGIDMGSGHPLLLAYVLPLFGVLIERIEQRVEQNPLFLGGVAFVASLGALVFLIVSRMIVAGAQGLSVSLFDVLALVYNPRIVISMLLATLGAILYEHVAVRSMGKSLLRYA